MQKFKSLMQNITGSRITCFVASTFKQCILTINYYKDWSFDRICKVQLPYENKMLLGKSINERYRKYKCCVFIDFEYMIRTHRYHQYIYSVQVSDWTEPGAKKSTKRPVSAYNFHCKYSMNTYGNSIKRSNSPSRSWASVQFDCWRLLQCMVRSRMSLNI